MRRERDLWRRTSLQQNHEDLILLEMPLYMHANSGGPLPAYSGVAGENGTCASRHASGAASVKTKGCSVAINFGSSQT